MIEKSRQLPKYEICDKTKYYKLCCLSIPPNLVIPIIFLLQMKIDTKIAAPAKVSRHCYTSKC